METQSTSNHLENEPELVERAKKDDAAFEILYNHYFSRIYGYIYKRCGSRETAEDLVSLTFMKVFTNLKNYQHQGYTFGAWVYRIATNNLIDFYRKADKYKYTDIQKIAEPSNLNDNDSPERFAELQQDKVVVQQVITKMSKKYQEIINLRYFAELSYREIAVQQGITENNARVLAHRALKVFHKAYEKFEISRD